MKKFASLTKLPDEVKREELTPLSQPALNDLRHKIKEAMIPLLIQIFHLRQAHTEGLTFSQPRDPSALQESETLKKIYALKKDLNQLSLWCSSCLSQIEKALSPPQSQRPKQCSTSKKNAHLKFSQLHPSEPHSISSKSLLEKLKSVEKSAVVAKESLFSRRSLRKVFSLAFSRNPRP